MRRLVAGAAIAVLAAVPAASVGMGPLVLNGLIDGPREGFTLDVYNPYRQATRFVAYAVGPDEDETPQDRVTILPAEIVLGPARSRRIMVIASDLSVGETYHFRVCAQRETPPEGISINARVCSKISAHRVG